jgi:hypothetical protein
MATWKVAVGAVVLSVVVWTAARSTVHEPSAPPVAARPDREAPPTSHVYAAPAIDTDALRAMVREELRAELATHRDGASVDAPPTAKTDANLQAAERGRALVEAGLARRVWTADDASRLRAAMRQMSRDDAESLLAQIVPAVNRGEVKLDGVRWPLGD